MIDGQQAAEKIGRIESLVCRVIRRDISQMIDFARGGLHAAARSIAEHPRPHVVTVAGFFIRHAEPPAAETDGLSAAAHIGAGFLGAGVPARIATDEPCAGPIQAAARVLPVEVPVDVVPVSAEAVRSLRKAWQDLDPVPTHLIAIERVGPARDGRPYREHGWDMSDDTAPLDLLFHEEGWKRPWTTIGIGDGGNEIGMGNLPLEIVESTIPNGQKVACVTPCDHLMVCGVSNWGGIALLGAVAILRPDLREGLLRTLNRETDHRVLESAVYDGPAIDDSRPDLLGKPQMTIDRLPWEEHAGLMDEIVAIATG
jgi:hypothetical protein